MNKFNDIARKVQMADDTFYKQRGVLIHSLEVSGYHCADASTARVLGEIIQETTNRMNRLQQQESQNEVQLQCIRGDIEEEKAKSELLEIQAENSNVMNKMNGIGEAEKIKTFLQELEKDVPKLDQRVALWQTLRKNDALETVGKGDAKLFFTPDGCSLKIET